jgi:hypothetical protein
VIQRDVEDAIADVMVTRELGEGDVVRIDAAGGEILASVERREPALTA